MIMEDKRFEVSVFFHSGLKEYDISVQGCTLVENDYRFGKRLESF